MTIQSNNATTLMQMQQQQQVEQNAAFTAALAAIATAIQRPSQNTAEGQPPPQQGVTSQTPPRSRKLPPELDTVLRKRTKDFKELLLKLVKSRKNLANLQDDKAKLDDGIYPRGYPQYKPVNTIAELNLELSPELIQEFTRFDITPGTSIRDSISEAYLHAAKLQVAATIEAQNARILPI